MLAKEITPIFVQQAKTCQLLQETTQSRERKGESPFTSEMAYFNNNSS